MMPRKPCYWTRKLELDLVEFVRQREVIWKPIGNTNHHIQQKYKAYAEFAASLGGGFTARSVRDRWVNIRSTFNHNLRRVDRSKKSAQTAADIYVPCWPLWKPLQFLRRIADKDEDYQGYMLPSHFEESSITEVKEECASDIDDIGLTIRRGRRIDRPKRKYSEDLTIKDHSQRTDRPRRRAKLPSNIRNNQCQRVIDDLVRAMKPLAQMTTPSQGQSYWFLGKHVTERLNSMREIDAECACRDIMKILNEFNEDDVT